MAESFIGAVLAEKAEKVDFLRKSKHRKAVARRREIKVAVSSEESWNKKVAKSLIMYHGVDSRK